MYFLSTKYSVCGEQIFIPKMGDQRKKFGNHWSYVKFARGIFSIRKFAKKKEYLWSILTWLINIIQNIVIQWGKDKLCPKQLL